MKKKLKTLSEIVLPACLPNLYIKKWNNPLQPVWVMFFLQATTFSLLKLIFYTKNKKAGINVTIFVRYYLSSRPKVFCKKGVLRNFSKFAENHLSWSVFFNKIAGLRLLLKLITIMLIEQYCEISFPFLYFTKEIIKSYDEFEQVNSGWLILFVFSCKGESFWNERHVFWICD